MRGLEEIEDGDDDDLAEEEHDAAASPGADGDAFDDLPETHLSDEDYDRYVARDLDAEGRPRGDPPVVLGIVVLIVLVLGAALLLFR